MPNPSSVLFSFMQRKILGPRLSSQNITKAPIQVTAKPRAIELTGPIFCKRKFYDYL
jgi:hypothetical protein